MIAQGLDRMLELDPAPVDLVALARPSASAMSCAVIGAEELALLARLAREA